MSFWQYLRLRRVKDLSPQPAATPVMTGAATTPQRQEESDEVADQRTARILVVDDEEPIRALMANVLGDLGHEVYQAATGHEALSLAKQHRPHLVLLDLMMPGMNGIEVCKKLRTMPELTDVRIIVVSGADARVALEESIIAGADDFLEKPFKSIELAVRVRSMLRVNAIHDEGQRVEAYIKTMQKLRSK